MQPASPAQALELMVYGMGTVVVFLFLLVYATRLMSLVVSRFFPEASTQPASGAAAGIEGAATPAGFGARGPSAPDARRIAAISAALAVHRRRRS